MALSHLRDYLCQVTPAHYSYSTSDTLITCIIYRVEVMIGALDH